MGWGDVRLGIELRPSVDTALLDASVEESRVAEDVGFDLLWIDEATAGQPAPTSLAFAAALAPHLRTISVGAVVHLGLDHPSDAVEKVAEVDRLLDGRLVTCLRPAPGTDDRFAEAVDRFLAGLASGPSTAQIEPTIWVAGDASVAATRGLAYVADGAADGAGSWPVIESALGRRALRLRRPARWPVDTSGAAGLDVHDLADELAAAQRGWGLDTAILTLPAAGREELMIRIAHDVRPRVQLDRLPPGLSEYWDGRMAARLALSTRATGGDDG